MALGYWDGSLSTDDKEKLKFAKMHIADGLYRESVEEKRQSLMDYVKRYQKRQDPVFGEIDEGWFKVSVNIGSIHFKEKFKLKNDGTDKAKIAELILKVTTLILNQIK